MNYEPFNEILASWLCQALSLSCCDYTIDYIQSQVVSRCACFIDENTELISAYALMHYYHLDKDAKAEDIFNQYIELLEKLDIKNAREYLVRMFILDYLVINEDRHLGNFGVIRDVNTLKFISVAPNYDSGLSMHSQKETYQMNYTKATGRFFYKEHYDYDDILDIVLKDYEINVDLEALNNVVDRWKELLIFHQSRVGLDNERIETMIKGLRLRIQKLNAYTSRKQV